jgi:transposase InsO family protein
MYLSPTIDCFGGMVVSWSIGTRPDAEHVNTMLDAAIESVSSTSERPVVHSDRGAPYRWPGWLQRIALHDWCARCRARHARRTTQRVKASSAD